MPGFYPLPHVLGNSPDAPGVPVARADHPQNPGAGRGVEEGGVKAVLFQFTLLSGQQPMPVAAVTRSTTGSPVPFPKGTALPANGELHSPQSVTCGASPRKVVWCSFDSEKKSHFLISKGWFPFIKRPPSPTLAQCPADQRCTGPNHMELPFLWVRGTAALPFPCGSTR